MRFEIVSIFPESFTSYFNVSIVKRAIEAELIEVKTHNLRDYTHDRHQKVDDTPFGGGAGMVMKVEPWAKCLTVLKQEAPTLKTRSILFSAKGKRFTQADARRLAQYERLILCAGRYEGVDERVAEHYTDEELSIGDFILTGGELPAMAVVDAVTRLLPGVLGNAESVLDESFSIPEELEYPQYTKPEEYAGHSVPPVLLSGHHAEITKWRKQHKKKVGA